ncbi:MAG: DNA polymerase III subunit delta' [Eubacterium sp.]|uniref:DNA polymerase III subunit delta' n=1 Tax=Eubacterium cellulosolvens (strain ATCC 43171 / JCM 9499 / 6) TaxID=633697 RepID=I5ATU4_EUBC6|nr:DNA polymerase III subunit delta' [Eubacterium sp.]
MREPDEAKGFAGIIGHRDVVTHMQSAVKQGKVSHAYIIGGEKGSGKRLLATIFAMTLQCEQKGIEPCGQCASCRKALSGSQPDIIYVHHEKPNSVGIDEIREQVVGDVSIRPYESRYKVYIIDDAALMTPQAQNALLKTIEEPPEYAIIILLADNPEALLPTIRSRCVTLRLKPVTDEEMKEYLMTQLHVPDYKAEVMASFAQGNIGRAKRIAESPEFMESVENAVRMMKRSKSLAVYEMIEAVKELAGQRQGVYDFMDVFLLWFHDVLMFKATREVDNLVFKDEINAIQERASVSSYEGIEKIEEAIQTAKDRLHANVNFDLSLELMFLTIREN